MHSPSEAHPESLTPRVFVYCKDDGRIFELLQDGQALQWQKPPIAEDGFRFWEIVVGSLEGINFVRPVKDTPVVAPIVPQEVIDQLAAAGLTLDDAANVLHEGNQYV